jgi:alanyl-tRNA synthetase
MAGIVLVSKNRFITRLVPVLAGQFKHVFPELEAQKEYVQNVILAEERSFLNTLGQGIQLFNEMIEGSNILAVKMLSNFTIPTVFRLT